MYLFVLHKEIVFPLRLMVAVLVFLASLLLRLLRASSNCSPEQSRRYSWMGYEYVVSNRYLTSRECSKFCFRNRMRVGCISVCRSSVLYSCCFGGRDIIVRAYLLYRYQIVTTSCCLAAGPRLGLLVGGGSYDPLIV